jgi:hypothetical protein
MTFCTVLRRGLTRFSFLAVAGGAGLLGGLVLTEAFEHHEQREEERAYDQGYDQGKLFRGVKFLILIARYTLGFDNGVVDDNNFGGW